MTIFYCYFHDGVSSLIEIYKFKNQTCNSCSKTCKTCNSSSSMEVSLLLLGTSGQN